MEHGQRHRVRIRVDLRRVLPIDDDTVAKIRVGGQYRKDGVKARWPRIKKLERVPSDGQIELEPGETDEFGFDFFVRYLSTKMRHPSLEFSEQPPLSRAC